MTRRAVIVAAFAAEVADVPDGVEVVLTGLGKTAASALTTERLLRGDRDEVEIWNVGTAGALRDGLSGVFTPGRVLNHDVNGEAIRALGLDPGDDLTLDGVPASSADATVLASGDVFVADPAVRARLAERAHLVDMEGYGVVFACQRLGVPVRLVKHVSDNADEAAISWNEAVAHSARELGAWLSNNLPN